MRPTLTASHVRFPVPQHTVAFTDHPRRGWTHRLGLALFLALAAALVVGCGSGSGGDGGVPIVNVSAHGRVVLGGVGGGTVAVYRVGEYGAPVATATIAAGPDLGSTGDFAFTLTGVPADAVFLLVASGGEAHDADEDGVVDGPTPNQGQVHALASVADLERQTVRLSAVTEVVYQRVRYFLEALYDDAYLARACDAWTGFVLRASLDGDPGVAHGDALTFDPRLHGAATFRPYGPRFGAFVALVLAGQPLTRSAFDLSREEIHFEDLAGQSYGIDLVGDRAYVARGTAGLDVWSVADPAAPVRLGGLDTPGYAAKVQVVGTLAYVADDSGGLRIIDVANPAVPVAAGSVATPGFASDLTVVGNRAYLCGGSTPGLFIVDVTTPATAALLGVLPLGGAARAVRVAGTFAYVLESNQIETVDVSDPTLPVSQGALPVDDYAGLDLGPGHLYVASQARLDVFTLANPAAPAPIASIDLLGSNGYGLRVRGTRAYVPRSFDGLTLVDVADPAHPVLRGTLPLSGSVVDADVDGGLLVFTEANGGFGTVGAGSPAPSGVVASLPRGGSVDAVEAVGSRVYVTTSQPNELVVLDATDPLAPAVLGAVPLASHSAEDVVVRGPYAYVAEYGGFHVYDVSNPAAPTLVSGDGTLEGLRHLALGMDVAYATASDFLGVYDVSDPTNVVRLRSVRVTGQALGLALDGNALVLATGANGTATFDVTTPTLPTLAGQVAMWGTLDVAVAPPFAFVTQYSGNGIGDALQVVDYSVLGAPTAPASVVLPGEVDRVVRSGPRAYVSARASGVNVVDLSTPTAPLHVGSLPVPATVVDLDVEGAFAYLAGGWPHGALHVLRASQAEVP